ncbi:hypothetical protein PG984_006960 [Apiospora sp. TS-2023a]
MPPGVFRGVQWSSWGVEGVDIAFLCFNVPHDAVVTAVVVEQAPVALVVWVQRRVTRRESACYQVRDHSVEEFLPSGSLTSGNHYTIRVGQVSAVLRIMP